MGDLLYKKLSQIDKKRQLTQSHLKDYKKMMQIIKKNIGEKRLNKLKMAKEAAMMNKPKQNKKMMEMEQMMQTMSSPVPSPSFGPMNGRMSMPLDRFRLQYLSAINIRKSNKKKFILSQFILQIDKFLGISVEETQKELNDLKDETDLINPITGKLNNPSTESKDANDSDTSEQKKEINEEIKEDSSTDVGMDNEEQNIVNEEEQNKKKSKYPRRLLIAKPLRQNVLKIIDKEKFILHEEKSPKEHVNSMVYSVSLREENTDENIVSDEQHVLDDVAMIDMHFENGMTSAEQQQEKKKSNGNGGLVDAPHRDWSVLAKHLKDSSKEQARRKQILKQLERILHVREGLNVGFDQLTQIYAGHQQSKIK